MNAHTLLNYTVVLACLVLVGGCGDKNQPQSGGGAGGTPSAQENQKAAAESDAHSESDADSKDAATSDADQNGAKQKDELNDNDKDYLENLITAMGSININAKCHIAISGKACLRALDKLYNHMHLVKLGQKKIDHKLKTLIVAGGFRPLDSNGVSWIAASATSGQIIEHLFPSLLETDELANELYEKVELKRDFHEIHRSQFFLETGVTIDIAWDSFDAKTLRSALFKVLSLAEPIRDQARDSDLHFITIGTKFKGQSEFADHVAIEIDAKASRIEILTHVLKQSKKNTAKVELQKSLIDILQREIETESGWPVLVYGQVSHKEGKMGLNKPLLPGQIEAGLEKLGRAVEDPVLRDKAFGLVVFGKSFEPLTSFHRHIRIDVRASTEEILSHLRAQPNRNDPRVIEAIAYEKEFDAARAEIKEMSGVFLVIDHGISSELALINLKAIETSRAILKLLMKLAKEGKLDGEVYEYISINTRFSSYDESIDINRNATEKEIIDFIEARNASGPEAEE
ncbi:MAG: hypothetical protein AB1540_02380 [Bdellovibrionota bacterium]